MIMAAHAADHLRHLQDFLPGRASAADDRRAKFFRPAYFHCPFEKAPVLAPLMLTIDATPSGAAEYLQRHGVPATP